MIRHYPRSPGLEPLQALAQKSTHDESVVRRYLAWMRVTGVDDAAALTDDRLTYDAAFPPVAASLEPLLRAPKTNHFADRIAYTSLRRWVAEDSNMRVDKNDDVSLY